MLKLWKTLEGNKTKIGFAIVGLGELVSQVKPDYGFALLVAGYVIGGVGLGDALLRAAKSKGV